MKHLLLGASIVFVAAFVASADAADDLGDPQAGFTYAEQFCSKCHGLSAEDSPLPQATRFREVADRPGMTATALQVWLQTSHPTMPNIIVQPQDIYPEPQGPRVGGRPRTTA